MLKTILLIGYQLNHVSISENNASHGALNNMERIEREDAMFRCRQNISHFLIEYFKNRND